MRIAETAAASVAAVPRKHQQQHSNQFLHLKFDHVLFILTCRSIKISNFDKDARNKWLLAVRSTEFSMARTSVCTRHCLLPGWQKFEIPSKWPLTKSVRDRGEKCEFGFSIRVASSQVLMLVQREVWRNCTSGASNNNRNMNQKVICTVFTHPTMMREAIMLF